MSIGPTDTEIQIVATPTEYAGYEDQFNEGYFRHHAVNPYENGSKACDAWEAGYQAWRAGKSCDGLDYACEPLSEQAAAALRARYAPANDSATGWF